MSHEQYRTVKDIAGLGKLGEAAVRRRIRDGELRAIGTGNGWRIAPADRDAVHGGHATRPAPTPDAASDGTETQGLKDRNTRWA